jgi:hypothetical protein
VIRLDTTTIIREGKETHEFKAVFHYADIENIASQLMFDYLVSQGLIEHNHLPDNKVRVESRYCEPDGEMGYRGSQIKICLMIGEGRDGHFPKLMESGVRTPVTKIELEDIPTLRQMPWWRRMLTKFF